MNYLYKLPLELLVHTVKYINIKDIDALTAASMYMYNIKSMIWQILYNKYIRFIPYYLSHYPYRELCINYLKLNSSKLNVIDIDNFNLSTTTHNTPVTCINYKFNNKILLFNEKRIYNELFWKSKKLKIRNKSIKCLIYIFDGLNDAVSIKSNRKLRWYVNLDDKNNVVKVVDILIKKYIVKICNISNNIFILDGTGTVNIYNKLLCIEEDNDISPYIPEIKDVCTKDYSQKDTNIYIDIATTKDSLYILDNMGYLYKLKDDTRYIYETNVIRIHTSGHALFVIIYKDEKYYVQVNGYHPTVNMIHTDKCIPMTTCYCKYDLYYSDTDIVLDLTEEYIVIYNKDILDIYKSSGKKTFNIPGIYRLFALPKYLAYFR